MGYITRYLFGVLGVFAFILCAVTVMGSASANYGIHNSPQVDGMLANLSTVSAVGSSSVAGNVSGWANTTTQNANDPTGTFGNVLWLTSGSLAVVGSFLAMPQIVYNIFAVFVTGILIPLGVNSAFAQTISGILFAGLMLSFVVGALAYIGKGAAI